MVDKVIDGDLALGIIAILILLLGFLGKKVLLVDIGDELSASTLLWEKRKEQIGTIFRDRLSRHEGLFGCLRGYFVGYLSIVFARVAFCAVSILLLSLISYDVYFAKWWSTGSLTIREFRTFFAIFIAWCICAFVANMIVLVSLRMGNSIRRFRP